MNRSTPRFSPVTHRSWRTYVVALAFLLMLMFAQAWQTAADVRLAQLDSLNLSRQTSENQPSLAVNWSCRSQCRLIGGSSNSQS